MKKRIWRTISVCAVVISCMSIASVSLAVNNTQTNYGNTTSDFMNATVYDNYEISKENFSVIGNVIDTPSESESKVAITSLEGDATENYNMSDYTICRAELVPLDDNTYQIVEDDEVIGLYSTLPPMISRGTWNYSWTFKAGTNGGSNDPVNSYNGLVMSFTTIFSSPGSSGIGYGSHNDQKFHVLFEKSDSFSGTMTFYKDIGPVSFGIANFSDHTITYSGTLSY